MASSGHPTVIEAWISVLFIAAVGTLLVANSLLLHGSAHKTRGLFSWNALRYRRFVKGPLRGLGGSAPSRSRSRSTSITSVPPTSGEPPPPPPDDAVVRLNEPACEEVAQQWKENCRQWLLWDPNPATRAIVERWMEQGDEDSANKLLMGKRLAFGTSGLRGAMGPGFCRINDLVVIQTTQGLCRYLEQQGGGDFKRRGIVIGRDHREQGGLSSEGFANLAAAVFVSKGFRVYLMSGIVATPLVSFGVSHLGACAGVMVTASHNPKKDNGYKVYWGNGSQIIPPHDVGIAKSVERSLEPWQVYDPESAIAGPLCSDPTETLAKAYYKGIGDGLCRRAEANSRSGLEVVYSAMHGVGDAWAQRAFRCFSLPPFLSVGCQSEPDPEFPTVAFPNPEEPGALKEAMILAEAKGVPFVLANDPDGDRLAAAERQPSGEWYVFSGNEIGVLLGVWQWGEWRRTHPEEDPSKAVMIASTVSSKMLSAVASREGFTFEETLPGFKWMGHRAQELKAEGKTILFAFEEAIGFGPGDVVFEKDGLSSAALFAEMVVALRDQDGEHAGKSEAVAAAAAAAKAVYKMLSGAPKATAGTENMDTTKVASSSSLAAATLPLLSPPKVMASSGPMSPTVSLLSPAVSRDGTGVFNATYGDEENEQELLQQPRQVDMEVTQKKPGRFSSVLRRHLKTLHERYGEFAEDNGYVRCEDTELVSDIFCRLRGDGSYRSSFGGYTVTAVRDLAEGHGYDSEMPDGKPSLPLVGCGAHFLTFKLGHEGVVASLRTSGTEPKIKIYLEMQGQPGVPYEHVSARLSEIGKVFVDEALEPQRWGMTRVFLG